MSAHPLRERLRAATHALHRALDEQLAGIDLGEPSGLRIHLSVHAAVLGTLEPALEAGGVQRWLADWEMRRRLPGLEADLLAHGGAIAVGDAASAAVRRLAQGLGDRAAILGAAYVLEGSRLGIRFLAGRIAPGPAGARFLEEPVAAQLWRSFLMQLEAGPWTEEAQQRAIATARATFSAYACAAQAILGDVGTVARGSASSAPAPAASLPR
jgi:heme oxygenase (biliverdin-IX-beta and delta-forming)